MNLAKIRKTLVAVLGSALTVGLGLGLHGQVQAILVSVAGLATAFGVYRVPNALPTVTLDPNTVQGGGSATIKMGG
jgi:hypothetical protein